MAWSPMLQLLLDSWNIFRKFIWRWLYDIEEAEILCSGFFIRDSRDLKKQNKKTLRLLVIPPSLTLHHHKLGRILNEKFK